MRKVKKRSFRCSCKASKLSRVASSSGHSPRRREDDDLTDLNLPKPGDLARFKGNYVNINDEDGFFSFTARGDELVLVLSEMNLMEYAGAPATKNLRLVRILVDGKVGTTSAFYLEKVV